MYPGILFKIAVSVTLSSGINLFERKTFSIEAPSSKWSAGRLVKVLFFLLEARGREFHALYKYYNIYLFVKR